MATKTSKPKERINRVGLADPRTGGERAAALINRVASGNRKAPVRKWDDTPAERAAKKRASAKPKGSK